MPALASLRLRAAPLWTACVNAVRSVLTPGQTITLDHPDQTLRVLSGQLWVTVDKDDILVKQGEDFKLPKGVRTALVTGLGKEGVRYEVTCLTDPPGAE